jgi:hypothetical protein
VDGRTAGGNPMPRRRLLSLGIALLGAASALLLACP